MLGGIHFLTGAALGSSLSHNSFGSFLIGVASHHFLDILPHIDTNIFGEKGRTIKKWSSEIWLLVVGEFFLLTILMVLLLMNKKYVWQQAFWGGIGGILPDIITIVFQDLLPTRNKLLKSYIHFQCNIFQFKREIKKFIFPSLFIYFIILIFDLAILTGL